MMHEPILTELVGLTRLAAPPPPALEPKPVTLDPLDLTLWRGTIAGSVLGLVAQVVPQTPPQVTWAMVAFAAVGGATLIARLVHSYFMARLEVDRFRGENTALRAEVETFRAARLRLSEPSDQ